MQHFYKHISFELEIIDESFDKQEPMELTADKQDQFDDATTCYTCSDEFDDDVIACKTPRSRDWELPRRGVSKL